jgi:hypothetical protein
MAHDRPDRFGRLYGAHHVDSHHGFEIFQLHFGKTFVPQGARIGDKNIDASECVDRLFDEMRDTRIVRNGRAVGDRGAPADLISSTTASAARLLPPVPSTAAGTSIRRWLRRSAVTMTCSIWLPF